MTSKDKPALSLKELSAKVVTLEVNSAQMLEAGQTQEKAVLRLHNKIEEVERQSIAYFAMKIKQCKKSVSEFISSRSNVLKGCE